VDALAAACLPFPMSGSLLPFWGAGRCMTDL
jgi:hypothetical protein